MTTLRAFHGQQAIKDQYVARVEEHQRLDQIAHGYYWENGRGCAVGCTIHSGHHAAYETELGIPQALAQLEDRIFEGMANGSASTWPGRFLSVIPVGADLSGVLPRFLLAIQERRYTALDKNGLALVGEAMQQVIAVLRAWAQTGQPDASAAESAARSAESAAASAARSARSAARSAGSAARSAESAARSAASAAESAEYEWQAQELLRLLAAAPILEAA